MSSHNPQDVDTPDDDPRMDIMEPPVIPSAGIRHRNLDNVPLQPMAIVSAAESEGLVRRAFNNRLIVFIFGILFTIALATGLGVGLSNKKNESENQWHLGLDVNDRDRYHLTVDQNTSTTTTTLSWKSSLPFGGDDEVGRQIVELTTTSAEYEIEELCDTSTDAWFRFTVRNYRLVNPMLDSIYHATSNRNVTQRFTEILTKLVVGHTWWAKLSHNSRRGVLRTDNRNFDALVELALYQLKAESSVLNSNPDELKEDMRRTGYHLLEEVQEEVYPHLQSAPNTEIGRFMRRWVRPLHTSSLQLNVTYEVQDLMHDLYKLTKPEVYLDETTFTPKVREGKPVNVTDPDQFFFLIHQSAHLEVTDTDLYTHFMASLLPQALMRSMKFDDVSMKIELEGLVVVGGQTGLVLDGQLVLKNNATVNTTYNISTSAFAQHSSFSTMNVLQEQPHVQKQQQQPNPSSWIHSVVLQWQKSLLSQIARSPLSPPSSVPLSPASLSLSSSLASNAFGSLDETAVDPPAIPDRIVIQTGLKQEAVTTVHVHGYVNLVDSINQ